MTDAVRTRTWTGTSWRCRSCGAHHDDYDDAEACCRGLQAATHPTSSED